MNEEGKSKVFFSLFFIVIVLLVGVGTYFLYFNKPTKKEKIINSANKVKVDKKKDFIYYEGVDVLSTELALIYKYPVINFKGDDIKKLNDQLKADEEALKDKVVKLDSVSDEEKSRALYTDDNIYSAVVHEYKTYTYDKYLSLVVREYTYNCTGTPSLNKFSAYVFDITTGTYLKQSELLKERDVLFSKIQSEVRNHLTNNPININEDEELDIDKTVAGLNESATIFIDTDGYINVEFIAKTNNSNYNDSIKLK